MSNSADAEIAKLLGELDAEFGKKKGGKEAAHKGLNRAFHAANPQLEKGQGKGPESDFSQTTWKPEARITYIVRQLCRCCNSTVEFIGGEYIRFRSKRQHAWQDRRSEHCPNLFLYHEDGEPLPDLIDELNQVVSRCPGCIAVERQAQEIWEQATAARPQQQTMDDELNINIEGL